MITLWNIVKFVVWCVVIGVIVYFAVKFWKKYNMTVRTDKFIADMKKKYNEKMNKGSAAEETDEQA